MIENGQRGWYITDKHIRWEEEKANIMNVRKWENKQITTKKARLTKKKKKKWKERNRVKMRQGIGNEREESKNNNSNSKSTSIS